MERRSQLDAFAMLLMVVLCASWGVQQVAIKVANAGVSPMLQAGLRSLGALACVVIWMRLKGQRLIQFDGSLGPGLLAGVLFAGEFALIYAGLAFTAASRSVIYLYTAPFVVAAGAHLWLGERLRVVQAIGLVCAFVGLVAAFADSLRLPTRQEFQGDLMVLAAALLWGATTLIIKGSVLARIPPAKTLAYQLGVSAALLPLASWLLGESGITRLSPLIVACLVYQTVLVAFASYLAWFWLVAHYPATRLSAFSFLTPLFGVAAGGLLLSERVTTTLLIALAFVAAGIYLVNRAPARPRASGG